MVIKYEKPALPVVLPLPEEIFGCAQPYVSLRGIWKCKNMPFSEQVQDCSDFSDWAEVFVPGNTTRNGESCGKRCGSYCYKHYVQVPKDYENQRIFLRFEGCNGYTKVWVNGHFAGEHWNAFITWNLEITEFVHPGEDFLLSVFVDEKSDRVSTFNHGGLLHDVKLLALPQTLIRRLHCQTSFDDAFENAELKVMLAIDDISFGGTHMQLRLFTPDGEEVPLPNSLIEFSGAHDSKDCVFPILAPEKWDSEHPRLYRLEACLYKNGVALEKTSRIFGFRQIDIHGNQMYVNGQEIKLRGVCRHEITPLTGRAVPEEMIEQDVVLFKQANVNYIRTSHYPPNEYFLDMCDKYGIYVEDELALAFIARSEDYTQRDPALVQRYISHFTELAERDRSHPCVIIWSMANESFGGHNFNRLNQYIHEEDPTRPTKFSYPMTMQEEDEPVDIWSIHYPELDSDLSKQRDNVSVGGTHHSPRPILHDEFAHIPCYNRNEHKRDPFVHHFWGESIKRFWDKIWNTPGALGGAIWAGIDETDIFTGGNTALEWGIIDLWRRPKPEYFMTRKAYSPVHIQQQSLDLIPGQPLVVEVENRFNHTNFDELSIEWRSGGKTGRIEGFSLTPRETGIMQIPAANTLSSGDSLLLRFTDLGGFCVDEFELNIGKICPTLPAFCGNAPKITQEKSTILLVGEQYTLAFSKTTGLILKGEWEKELLISGGPYLNAPFLQLPPWECHDISASAENNTAVVRIAGSYGEAMDVTFILTADDSGLLRTEYILDKVNIRMPRSSKLRVGVDCGGLDELGVYFTVNPQLDTLSWERNPLWSAYPPDHIGRAKGECQKVSDYPQPLFAHQPLLPWAEEMVSYILYGKYDIPVRGTNDFRSTKEHIYRASLSAQKSGGRLTALSDGKDYVRMEIVPSPKSMIDDRASSVQYTGTWYAVTDVDGSFCGTEMWSKTKGDSAEITFHGTGIAWIGSTDVLCGIACVYVDGKQMDSRINQRVNGVEFTGSAPGYDKRYGITLYSIRGLSTGEHTLRIEVTGEKEADASDCYIIIDAFRLLESEEDNLHFILNNAVTYPHIAWGNYSREPILVKDGYRNQVYLRLEQNQ